MTDAATDTEPRRRNPLIVLIVITLLAMWGYVVYLAFFVGRADSPDKIDEAAFIESAEARCAEALVFVDSLPRAELQADDRVGRADTIAEATDAFDEMVADVRDLSDVRITDPANADLVSQWLGDWEILIADRYDFGARLRVDPEARLLVTPGPSGRQISLRIDEFAGTNEMASCRSPLDV